MRTAFVQTLIEEAERDGRIWLLTGDLGFSVLEPFIERFPGRFVNAGVAEQNMMGVAAGLALSGKIVFIYSIANFPTLRCLEQIRNDVCGHKLSVKIVTVGGGFSYGSHGYSHHGIEDIAVMRILPGLEIAVPADAAEARVLTRVFARTDGPSYLRLGRGREPAVHNSEPALPRGIPAPVKPGSGIALLAAGPVLGNCVKAAEGVNASGLDPAVYSMPWIKPMDADAVAAIAGRHEWLLTVEEATAAGGLGGAVAEILSGLPQPHARLKRLGTPDQILAGSQDQDSSRAIVGIGASELISAMLTLSKHTPPKTPKPADGPKRPCA